MPTLLIRFPHGLGDCVQFSVVLNHLKKHRPNFVVDVHMGIGKEKCAVGLCRRVFHDKGQQPVGPYDTVVEIGFYENYTGYPDRPNSKVTNCLQEVFGLPWDAALGRYEVAVSGDAMRRANEWLRSTGAVEKDGKFNVVIVHGQGNTSPWKKNLAHWQCALLCDFIRKAGRVPVVLDWDRRSPLPDGKTVFCPHADDPLWGGIGTGDAEVIAALIKQSEAFIGVDSGPGKVASSTDTPTLICWTGHHPIQFHDPAENTTHLIPADHRRLPPVHDHSDVGDWFEKHYLFQTYSGGHGLVAKAKMWLGEVLDADFIDDSITFVTPGGIGDSMWALLKARNVADGRPIDLIVSGNPHSEIDRRSLPFLKRFPFIRSARVLDVPHLEEGDPNDAQGRYRYLPDGPRGSFHYLMPNRALEQGKRIEDWLPEVPIDWNVIDEFDWSGTERGLEEAKSMGNFAAFYLGPESGHTDEGHNRDWLWEPKHWIALGRALKERGLNICVVGAPYDRSFWDKYVRQGVKEDGQEWSDKIGLFEIGETFALLRQAKCFISYQCGLGILNHYFGGRTAMWWRPDGNSCSPHRKVCFDERMASSWTRPDYADRYIGMIYNKWSVGDLIGEIDKRGWTK